MENLYKGVNDPRRKKPIHPFPSPSHCKGKAVSNSTFNMRTSITLLTAFLAAAVAQDYPFTEYVCETSDGSPYLHHVNQLIDGLAGAPEGDRLCNTGSGCGETITAYSGGGGAGLMLCGDSYRV